jgi:hypothetical protein
MMIKAGPRVQFVPWSGVLQKTIAKNVPGDPRFVDQINIIKFRRLALGDYRYDIGMTMLSTMWWL